MNERIKELITQARGHWNNGDFNMPSSVEFQAEDIEKFAELIVRECADIAREWSDYYVVEDTAPKQVDMFIKQHFGVEE